MSRYFRGVLFLCLALMSLPVFAQTATPPPPIIPKYEIEIIVGSAFTRQAPTTTAPASSSVFRGDRLLVIGRNADGRWLEVTRLSPKTRLGWLSIEMVRRNGFEVYALPLTDAQTGVSGTPIQDNGVAVLTLYESAIRAEPDTRSPMIAIAPRASTLPAITRTEGNLWVQVNYLGTVGWISSVVIATPPNIEELPVEVVNVPGRNFEVLIIPPETQLAQVNRMRSFVAYPLELSSSLVSFWDSVKTGEVVPCEPPGFVRERYQATFQDYRELPELRRYLPSLNTGLEYLNKSIEIIQPCGVYTSDQAQTAYANALNAVVALSSVMSNLDYIEMVILGELDY